MSALAEYDGQAVTLTTADDQIYKGTMRSLDEHSGKIVLKNVSTNGLKLPGLQNFFVSSIKELSLTNQLQASRASDNPVKGGRRQKTPLRFSHHGAKPHLQKLLRFDSDQLVRPHCTGGDSGDQGIGSGEDNITYDDFYEEENYIIFCNTGDKFRESIVVLMEQSEIAVTFYGTDIGRKGTLSLIQVATAKDIFLYDILRLGAEGFVDGLQAVFESSDVLKIIHDCRLVSDLLSHQFQVSLANVFDTQVSSAFVFRSSNDGNWPRFVESLPGALMTHLGLSNEEVHHFFVRERLKQRDEEVWLQRPLCTQLIMDSLKNLIHMIPLCRALKTQMIAEFHVGVQLYLDQVRNAPSHKVDRFSSSSHLLPFVFQDLPQLTKHFSKTANRVRCKYEGSKGFVDVCPKSGPNMVTTSRDGIWHSKHQLCIASCNCKCGSKKVARRKEQQSEANSSDSNAGDSERKSPSPLQPDVLCKDYSSRSTGDIDCNRHRSLSEANMKNSNETSQNNLFPPQKSNCVNSEHSVPTSPPLSTNRTHSSLNLISLSSSSLAKGGKQSGTNCHHSPSSSSATNQTQSNNFRSPSDTTPTHQLESQLHCFSRSSTLVAQFPKEPSSSSSHNPNHEGDDKSLPVSDIKTPRRHLAIEKSALWKLGSTDQPSKTKESLSGPRSKNKSCDMQEQDADKVYDSEMVKKVLKQARQQNSNKTIAKSRLLPSKSKTSFPRSMAC